MAEYLHFPEDDSRSEVHARFRTVDIGGDLVDLFLLTEVLPLWGGAQWNLLVGPHPLQSLS